MIVQCCVCGKVRHDGRWESRDREVAATNPMDISHGYCPACAAEAFAEVRRWAAMERRRAQAPVA